MDKTVQAPKTKHWSQWKLWGVLKLKKKFTTKLPPEMEEEILKKISDLKTLVKCRQVCSQWKQFIDSELEQKRLSQWTAWDLDLDSYHHFLNPPIWVVDQTSSSTYRSSHVSRPPALKAETGENPFPLKSVALIICDAWHSHKVYKKVCPQHIYKFNETIAQFFTKSGHFLTSLVLHKIILLHRDFALILTNSQHLKALSLYSSDLINFNYKKMAVTVPPNLTHLQVYHNCEYLFWLLGLVSPQLVSLKLVKHWGSCLDKPLNFSKLKQLYIYNDDGIDLNRLFTNLRGLPVLEYFNAIGMDIPCSFVKDMESFITSLSSIATSLVYFRLRISTHIIREVFEKCGVVFPTVRVLEIVRGPNEPEIDKLEISDWFPGVESVTCVVDNRWYARFSGNVHDCLVCEKERARRAKNFIFKS